MLRALTIGLALIASGCASVEKTPITIHPVAQIKSAPFDPEEVLEIAQAEFEAENYTKALEEYLKVSAYDPKRLDARLGLGESLLALGHHHRAAKIFWLEAPGWQDGEFAEEIEIGRILSGIYTNRFENIETAINDGMVIDPNDARLWNAKGRLHDRNGDWMEALSCYVVAMELGEWQSGTVNNMGMSLLIQGRFIEAREKFEQALTLSPETHIYDNNLRMAHILTGDLKSALDDISEKRAADILNDAGYVAFKGGKPGLAERLFDKAIEISPVFHAEAQANLNRLQAQTPSP